MPSATTPSAAIRHSTVNVCACASPAIDGHDVLGHGDAARLQPFLEARLRVLAERGRIEVGELGRVDALDHAARRVEAGIDEHGAEDRLQRVGEDRRPVAPPLSQLALAQADLVRESEPAREPRQRVRG